MAGKQNGGADPFADVPVQTSESLARRDAGPKGTDMVVLEQLNRRSKTLERLLNNVMDSRKFQTVALTTIRTNDKLMKCSPVSLVTSIMMAAQRGLSLDPTLGHAYLVPYWNKSMGCFEAQYQTGYQGKIFLAKRDGNVVVDSWVVYKNDTLTICRTAEGDVLEHTPTPLDQDPGPAIGYVARGRMPDGRTVFEVMRKADVEKIRDTVTRRYGGKSTPAWEQWFDEMGRGKVVNRLAKYLPQCPTLQLDAAQESALDGGAAQVIDVQGEDGSLEPLVVPAGATLPAPEVTIAQEAPRGPVTPAGAPGASHPDPAAAGEPRGASTASRPATGAAVTARGALGAYIREERTRNGVSQKVLAEAVGVSASTLGRIESGEIRPEQDIVERVAQYLALDSTDLLAVGGYVPPPAPAAKDDGLEPPADLFALQAQADEHAPDGDDN